MWKNLKKLSNCVVYIVQISKVYKQSNIVLQRCEHFGQVNWAPWVNQLRQSSGWAFTLTQDRALTKTPVSTGSVPLLNMGKRAGGVLSLSA